MTTPSCPYKPEELFNSENKNNRNVHNDVNKYMRNVMGVPTPITKETRPSLDAIKDSIMNTAKDSAMNKILFDLRETSPKVLFPESNGVPSDTTIGRLYQAVIACIPEDDENETQLLKKRNQNHLSLDYFIGNNCALLIDAKKYHSLLQDQGFELKEKKRPKKCYVETDTVNKKVRAYSDIYTLAASLYDILNKYKNTFEKLPKNKSSVINKICKFIYDNRHLVGFADIQDQRILDLMKVDDTGSDLKNPEYVYLYEQKHLFAKLYNIWCPIGIERKETTVNDKLRVFGIMLSNDYRDEMSNLSKGKGSTRDELDNPELRVSKIFEAFSKAFNDKKFHIEHPVNYEKLAGAQKMNPNEKARIEIERDGKWFRKVYDNVMTHYRPTMVRYKSDTGNGRSGAHNFSDWKLRDVWEFQKFDKIRGGWLNWIYMKDLAQGWILDAKSDDIPKRIQCETTKTGNSNLHNNKKSPPMSSMDAMGKQIEKFETMSNEFFNSNKKLEPQTIKLELNSDQSLQVKLENIKELQALAKLYTNDPEKKEQFDIKINSLLEQALALDKPVHENNSETLPVEGRKVNEAITGEDNSTDS